MPNKNKKKQKAQKGENAENITDPEQLKNIGNELYSKAQYEEAIAMYSKAIDCDTDKKNPVYFSNRAQVYLKLEDFDRAVEDCDNALFIDPSFAKAYFRKAQALREMPHVKGADKQALEVLKEGLAKNPDNEPIQLLLEEHQKEYDEDYSVPLDDPERMRFETFFDWMRQDGANFDKLKLRYYGPDYRGVHAARDIKKGEQILYVPKKELITLEMAIDTPIGRKMFEKGHRQRLISPKHSFLATFLMQEKRKETSYFQQYIDILPKEYNNFPIFYTEEERKWLTGSPFLDQIKDKIKDIQTDYDLICKEVPEFAQFPIREYSELRMMVASRIFGISIDGFKTDGFCCYADMLNHKRPRQTSWQYVDEQEGFVIEAIEDIARGEQVYDSYGRKCNSRFMINYGFHNPNNDANEVPIDVYFDPEDPLLPQKLDMLDEPKFKKGQRFRVLADFLEPIMQNFLSFVRFAVFDDNITILYQIKGQAMEAMARQRQQRQDDSDSDDNDDKFEAKDIKPISIDNERKMLKKIRQFCENGLAKYPETWEQDMEILETQKLTFNQENMVKFRAGEKYILNYLIEVTEIVEPLLDMKFKDAKKKAQVLPSKLESVRNYIHNQVMPLILREESKTK